MGPKLLESRLCLLLLLGLVLMLASCQAQILSQKFYTQHIYNSTYPRCDAVMRVVNRYRPRCKDINTFLHTSFADVVAVCGHPNITCNNLTRKNCHASSFQVFITFCNLTMPTRICTQCRYQTTGSVKYYRVACENRTPQDTPMYPVVPVHLDGTF
uniref:Non-secretory ribonuclease n=1 Tax=Mus musculus TaxID=10090 RepID=RNAS2_MOUSE|nr:non-secretory ribonuclease precursor [Mus musculus]O35291.1 RecName: Full=Non-secretory ribonuclease; AltName: Full=Eosinophil cationic-type ribonuclease 4; AltName: Full=MR-4; AltName: Full=Ribonuclease 2; Short=RNase 2; Flags: Precursor [Mus musculus]AAC53490.1 ribonuclease 4 precursor [Mus musculus]